MKILLFGVLPTALYFGIAISLSNLGHFAVADIMLYVAIASDDNLTKEFKQINEKGPLFDEKILNVSKEEIEQYNKEMIAFQQCHNNDKWYKNKYYHKALFKE